MNDVRDRPVFRVEQIDHVELFVPDRREAADWYRQVFGLSICPDYEHWAGDPHGPLMISSDGGSTKLALFEGRPQGDRETAGYHLVAFRVSGADFEAFLDRLDGLTLTDHHDRTVTRELVQDHGQAASIYFNDPYGHRLELTTYDVEGLRCLPVAAPERPAEPDREPDVEITSIEAAENGAPPDGDETRAADAGEVMWMCHGCSARLSADRGLVCSKCYRSTCPDCVATGSADEPVCKSCHGETAG